MKAKYFPISDRIQPFRDFGKNFVIKEEAEEDEEQPLCRKTKTDRQSHRQGLHRVVVAWAVASLGIFSSGIAIVYPSPAIPDINAYPGPYMVTTEEQSWAISIVCLGGILGSMMVSTLMDNLGRKITLIVGFVPAAIGWLTIITSRSAAALIAGQAVLGVSICLYTVTTNAYVAEIAPQRIRGLLMAALGVSLSTGSVSVFVLGACVRWNWLAGACLIPPALLVVLVCFIPESPRWLLVRGKADNAAKALAWLRDCPIADIQDELADIEAGISADGNQKTPWINFLQPRLLRSLAISQALSFLQELSGITIVGTYTVTIFQATSGRISPNVQTIVVGAAFLVGNICCCIVIERFRRRSLLLFSTIVSALGWGTLGVYFAAEDGGGIRNLYWLPMLSLATVVFSCSLGITAFTAIVTNELFSTEARGRASSMSAVSVTLSAFLVTKCFAGLSEAIGIYGAFWCFAGVCILGAVFAYFCLPETGGEKLEAIQEHLK